VFIKYTFKGITKLKKNSMKTYFLERCTGGAKIVNLLKTVKPFFSKKMTEVDFYGVVYFSLERVYQVPF
jgi:hypothetical protein